MDHFVRGGLRFPVADGGDPAGEVVVLLHGFPQQPLAFRSVLPALHRAGLRTLVPSQRGYVASARPSRRRDYATVQLVADVVRLLDVAGVERAHVVGHDWGSAQAWGMAGLRPDRTASVVSLSVPHPKAMVEAMRHGDQARRSWYMAYFQIRGLAEAGVRRSLPELFERSGLPPEQATAYVDAMAEPGALTAALNWYRGIPFSTTDVGMITRPTTLVWGRRDIALGRTAAELTQRYVSAPYAFVELDAGHWLPETRSAAVAEAIIDRVRPVPVDRGSGQ